MPRLGQTVAYRPMPRDFVDTFCRVGWRSIELEVRAHKTTIVRWIREHDLAADTNGTPHLKELRRQWLQQHYAAKGQRIPGGFQPGRKRYPAVGAVGPTVPYRSGLCAAKAVAVNVEPESA